MSRFDDFAKSRAEGRGLFSALKRTRQGLEPDGESGVSRRDLMKKAGLVTGAAVVGSTLIQSVTAPAWAASCTGASDSVAMCGGAGATPCPRCINGLTCTNGTDCVSGYCSNSTCADAPLPAGTACVGINQQLKDASCATGYCGATDTCATRPTNVAFGSPCHAATQTQADSECGTGSNGVCQGMTTTASGTCKVKDGEICASTNKDANCASGKCSSNSASGVCKRSTGATCTTNSDCASNKCTVLGVCGP